MAKDSTDEILGRARDFDEAVSLLTAAGKPPHDAREIAAIAFGKSNGDVKGDDQSNWASTLAARAAG